MKRLLLTFSLLSLTAGLLLAVPADLAPRIDLTPRPALAAGDGMEQPVMTFQKGRGCVALLQLSKWSAAGSAETVTFSKQDASQASIKMSLVPKPIALEDPTAAATVKQMLLATVPRDATEINVVAEGRDALSINGWKSVDAQVTFNFYGNLMHRSLSLWSQGSDTQLQLIVSSFDRDFEATSKSATRFLNTWNEVSPEQMVNFKFNNRE